MPVIAKVVGWGFPERTAKLLADCGVSAIDVAGAGGTSWSQVEMYRAPGELPAVWRRPLSVGHPHRRFNFKRRRAAPELPVFASGGLKDGLDIAKCLALGATLGGMAGNSLKAAAISTEKAVELIRLTKRQIEVTMFVAGAKELQALREKIVP